MRTLAFASLIFAASIASAQTEIADYKLNVQDFQSITVVDGVNVDYHARPDSAGWALFSCRPEIASNIMFSNNHDHLTIQTTADDRPLPNMPRITVYSSGLRNATNTGDSTLRLLTTAPAPSLKLKEMGNGRIEAYGIEVESVEASVDTGCGSVFAVGTARKGKLRNVGTGVLDADSLSLEQASIFIFGSGPVMCSVSDKITVYGIGPGKVLTAITPTKVSNRSLGVKVEPLEPEPAAQETPESQAE